MVGLAVASSAISTIQAARIRAARVGLKYWRRRPQAMVCIQAGFIPAG
jgi:hypothetical protein